ncbi:MAG: hypothetical protein DHS20C17_14040 [Cyclobacteriaceae bacterium]|nr:MAG: hypothetical protein DHS20C17_14040 [Cyclobacteriaceae bacterium]
MAEVLSADYLQDQLNQVKQLGNTLVDNGYSVEYRTFNQTFENLVEDSVDFGQMSSPLNRMISSVQIDYEGKNLTGMVLVSDGIHNQGLSPAHSLFKFPIYTVAAGDTIPQQDIRLKAIHYNKIAYQGNKFIIRAEILNDGFRSGNIEVSIRDGQRVLQSKTLQLSSPPQLLETDFELDATRKGLQDYTVSISPLEGEFTQNNNQRHAYIEIIEGSRNILLASKNPHPDIKAIKNAIESNQNYQLHLYIPGITTVEAESYDLLILHQISPQELQNIPVIANHLNTNTPRWTIVGSRSNLNRVNSENPTVSIRTINLQKDQVAPSLNDSFSKFQFSQQLQQTIERFNPVTVPFANYEVGGGAEVLLFQKVGNLVTANPLLLVTDDGSLKTALMIGEGMWQWRMQDYAMNQSFELFDELISKLIQYLSSNREKSRFKVYPVTLHFNANEPAVLKTEVYNEIYEETYGHSIELALNGPDGYSETYSYVTSQGNNSYRISDLLPGVYTFQASTSIDGKPTISQGQFTITEMALEALNLTADFQLLRGLSAKSAGKFYLANQWESLTSDLITKKAQGVIFSEEIFKPLIRWPWALIMLLALVTAEWFLRKYHGTY